jgi:hypothetical protein
MILQRLRRSQISDEDFRVISQTMRSLIYKTRVEMAAAVQLTPRSLRRIFNSGHRTGPQQRIEIFNRYLRAIEAELSHARFTHQHRPRPRR